MNSQSLAPRCAFIFWIFAFIFFCIVLHLYSIQIRQSAYFKTLGLSQYNVSITKPAQRGLILDRHGTILANNRDSLAAFIIPRQIRDEKKLSQFLLKHFPHCMEQLKRKKNKHFMYVKRKLTEQEIELIKNQEDVHLLVEQDRFYPFSSTATIIGSTDIDNNGLFGIELMQDELLKGKPTTYQLERDARSGNYYFTKATKIAGQDGTAVQLTIDAQLQFLVEQELQETITQFQAQQGAVIIINPETGEIPVACCLPHFNPQEPIPTDLSLTKNIVLSDAFELGSVFKVFGALAASEEQVVQPEELIDCKNTKTTYIDGRRINTIKEHGVIPFTDVIAFSNNIGIAIVAKRLGKSLYDHYVRLGFGQKTGIQFPNEHKGFINPPENWSAQSIISLSYGYEVTSTLLQLALAFCLIANNGRPIKPTLLLNEKRTPEPSHYSAQAINTIKKIMQQTTEHGTTKKAALAGYTILAKTGTANLLENGQYNPDKNIYTCAAIVEKDNYKRVIVTFIKEAKQKDLYASSVTAPLLGKVAQIMLIREKII